MDNPAADPQVDQVNFDAPPGGVMTVEVGAVTGSLTLTADYTTPGRTQVRVSYQGAQEDYVVQGSPVDGQVAADEILNRLTRPAATPTDPDANPPAVSLE